MRTRAGDQRTSGTCTACDGTLPSKAQFCPGCGEAVVRKKRTRKRPARREKLAQGRETILWRGSFSARALLRSWLLAILITFLLPAGAVVVGASSYEWTLILGLVALVWLGLMALLCLQKLNISYVLSDQRLVHRSGILRRRTDRIELIDIDDVGHEQGLVDRLCGVGTIEIHSSDRSHPVMELPGIAMVEQVAQLIDDARRRERIRRGIHIEQI